MRQDMESLWGAMKDVHYQRTLDTLKHSLRDARNLNAALSVSLDTIVEAIHAVSGTFWFYERYRDGRIYPKSVYGGGNLGGISLLPGEGIAGGVIDNGKSVIIQDCQADPRWAGKADAKTGFRTESMICVPLVYNEDVFGCIQIINKSDGMHFDDSDLEFAKGLAQNSADLFQENGMLEDYFEGRIRSAEDRRAVSFMEVMGAPTLRDMEDQIRMIEQFGKLSAKDQDQVMGHAEAMYSYLGPKSSKHRGIGAFFRK